MIYYRTSTPIPLLMVAVAWYATFTTLLSALQFYVERHYARGTQRTLPPTPWQRTRRAVAGWWRSPDGGGRRMVAVAGMSTGEIVSDSIL